MDGALILDHLRAAFGAALVEAHDFRGDHTAVVARDAIAGVLRHCRDEAALGFDVLMDLTAVDYLVYPGREGGSRFEVVYHLYSIAHNHRLRVKVRVPEEDAVVPTVMTVWPIADWMEREVWDMFGIRFAGHPDLRRLLLYEEFVGHPLRKDYPINRRQPLIGPRI
ncbi:MAG: NADH-quinone oxidoreductase subunit C [Candidatus Rokubacteria bacterium]|nr:NADH-quinone oxidoreductase subunit C [Candidatus Rokubacteria bacterium]MBI3824694.1 NADH-quinone oxidoreductase subunit C [Candidatus Rokubacteria bacterium]